MANDPIKVVGLAEVQRALKQLGIPAKEIGLAGFEAAQIVAIEARTHTVPVRSGKLRDNIKAAKVQRGAVVRVSGLKVPYAGPIHFGWFVKHILPNPFLYRAMDKRIGEVYEAYFAQMDKLISRVGGASNVSTATRKPKPKGHQGGIMVTNAQGSRPATAREIAFYNERAGN